MALTSENKKIKKCCSACDIGKRCIKHVAPKEDEIGPELDIDPLQREQRPQRQGYGGRRDNESVEMPEPESSGIEDEDEGPAEVVIHTPISRRTR